MFVMVPFKLLLWSKHGTISVLLPACYFRDFLPLLKYCLSLMAFSIFVLMAEKLRPIILGIRIQSGAGKALSEYQIINNFRIFLTMVSASFMVSLIPYISGVAAGGNSQIYQNIIRGGTKYIWAFSALIGFGIILLSKEALAIYVGNENLIIILWLRLLIIGALYNLYISPIASVIISSGKLAPMILSSASGCIVSILICWFFCPDFGVGAITISLISYNFIHLIVTHFWYLPKYFNTIPFHQISHIMFAARIIWNYNVLCWKMEH